MPDVITAIDLCCGAGGWACAARGLPIRIAAAVDLWDRACRTYRMNHPETEAIVADLRDDAFRAEFVQRFAGKVDLILGGIPCEWLSTYRHLVKVKQVEFEEQRATLDSVLAMVKAIAPRYWCLEDVNGITRELPLFTPYQRIDARRYGPQRRKRTYVGDFPAPPLSNSRELMRDRLRPGPFRIGPRAADRTPVTHRSFAHNQSLAAFPDRKAPTMASIGSRRDAEIVVVDKNVPGGKRQVEWQESARLQGFPEDYVFYGSPTDVALMVGRAVQIDTGRAILQSIVAHWSAGPRVPAIEEVA